MSVHIGNYHRIVLTSRKAHEVTILRMKKGERKGDGRPHIIQTTNHFLRYFLPVKIYVTIPAAMYSFHTNYKSIGGFPLMCKTALTFSYS
jgi:hypothetical protein